MGGAKSSVSKDLLTRVEGGFKEVACKDPVPGPAPDNLHPITSPLTRILVNEIDNYPAADVDAATKEILLYTNIEDLTIPSSRRLSLKSFSASKRRSRTSISVTSLGATRKTSVTSALQAWTRRWRCLRGAATSSTQPASPAGSPEKSQRRSLQAAQNAELSSDYILSL